MGDTEAEGDERTEGLVSLIEDYLGPANPPFVLGLTDQGDTDINPDPAYCLQS
jgi:hypothetical protein